jgi:hypothetical protein
MTASVLLDRAVALVVVLKYDVTNTLTCEGNSFSAVSAPVTVPVYIPVTAHGSGYLSLML